MTITHIKVSFHTFHIDNSNSFNMLHHLINIIFGMIFIETLNTVEAQVEKMHLLINSCATD